MSENTDPLVKRVASQLIVALGDGKLDAADIMSLVAVAVELAEQLASSGEERKKLVIEALELVINNTVDDPATAATLRLILPQSIDVAVRLAKGVYAINKKQCSCLHKCHIV